MTNKTNRTDDNNLMFKQGGYRDLKSYQMSTIVYDTTVEFCKLYISKFSRTNDQMVQAARSRRQNIAEGSRAAGTSKKSELKLTNVARASLEELLLDYEDFIRQNGLRAWIKDDFEAKKVRNLCYGDLSYSSYRSYLKDREQAANMMTCVIHQTNYLLDQQLRKLEKELLDQCGFTERLYNKRRDRRGY